MGNNFKRAFNYWFPKVIGTIILSYQLYKYVKNQINSDNYIFEGCIFVVGVAFFIKMRWVLNVAEKVIMKKTDSNE